MIKINIELWPEDKKSEIKQIANIVINSTDKINNTHEKQYEYSGWYQNKGEDEFHKFKGKVEHWNLHPVLLLLYKVLFKEMKQWIDELKWDY